MMFLPRSGRKLSVILICLLLGTPAIGRTQGPTDTSINPLLRAFLAEGQIGDAMDRLFPQGTRVSSRGNVSCVNVQVTHQVCLFRGRPATGFEVASVSVIYANRHLSGVRIEVERRFADDLRSMVATRYGAPHARREIQAMGLMGEPYSVNVLEWRLTEGILRLHEPALLSEPLLEFVGPGGPLPTSAQ